MAHYNATMMMMRRRNGTPSITLQLDLCNVLDDLTIDDDSNGAVLQVTDLSVDDDASEQPGCRL